MAEHLRPADVIERADKEARRFLKRATPLAKLLERAARRPPLNISQRRLIVDQAIMFLDGFYANLPLKQAMYAVDPLQRLRLFRSRLQSVESDRAFHAEMTDIFASMRDAHARYILPEPFNSSDAFLPFAVKSYFKGDRRRYIVGNVAFAHPTFRKGAEILSWNGIPIARAVELMGAQSAGGNPGARHAHGLARLTVRALDSVPPPDEHTVTIQYQSGRNREEIRLDWMVSHEEVLAKERKRIYETERIRRHRKSLYARNIRPGEFGDVLESRTIKTAYGKVGYIRIRTFDFPKVRINEFLATFIRLLRRLPRNRLIIDVRDNPGGRTAAAERLLQIILPPQRIEPARLYFISTPWTLELCRLQRSTRELGPRGLSPWIPSIARSQETGAMYSASFPYTDPEACNSTGSKYRGRVIVITNALSYSAAEYFAAGFQDHGGKILGVDPATGGAGGNLRTHEEVSIYFEEAFQRSPFRFLPRSVDFWITFRNSTRVGRHAGDEIEDFGVERDFYHRITHKDLMNNDASLMNRAAKLLRGRRARRR